MNPRDNHEHPSLEVESMATNMLEFLDSVNTAQNNPHHIYDVKGHTLAVVKAAEEMGCDEDVILAAYLHDVGKSAVKAINPKTGFDAFFGHPKKSIEVAEAAGFDLPVLVRQLIELHENFFEMNEKNVSKIDIEVRRKLVQLRRADIAGQNPELANDKLAQLATWETKYC